MLTLWLLCSFVMSRLHGRFALLQLRSKDFLRTCEKDVQCSSCSNTFLLFNLISLTWLPLSSASEGTFPFLLLSTLSKIPQPLFAIRHAICKITALPFRAWYRFRVLLFLPTMTMTMMPKSDKLLAVLEGSAESTNVVAWRYRVCRCCCGCYANVISSSTAL